MTTINGKDSGLAGRLGFDTKLDFSFGLWLEGNFLFIEKYPNPDSVFIDNTIYKFQAPVTLGIDYTWSVGNGIYTMAEIQLWAETGSPLRKLNRQYLTFAMTANYPIGLLDTVHYFGVVRDDATVSTHTLIWRRIYDRWSFDASLFWDAGKLYNQYNSRGIKLVAAYIF